MTLQKMSGFIVQVRHSARTQKIGCKNCRFCAWIQCKDYVSLPGFRSPPLRFALCLWFSRSARRDKAVRHWLGHVQTEQARGQVQINQLRRCLPAQPQWISTSSFLIQVVYFQREKERERDTYSYLSYYICENLHSLYIDGFGYSWLVAHAFMTPGWPCSLILALWDVDQLMVSARWCLAGTGRFLNSIPHSGRMATEWSLRTSDHDFAVIENIFSLNIS